MRAYIQRKIYVSLLYVSVARFHLTLVFVLMCMYEKECVHPESYKEISPPTILIMQVELDVVIALCVCVCVCG